MTPAETLTAAADRIERVAQAATPGPYFFTRSLGYSLPSGEWSSADVFDSHGEYLCSELSDTDAAHMDEVDSWLREEAGRAERIGGDQ